MPPKPITPSVKLSSFSCPRFGAHADQRWFKTAVSALKTNGKPFLPDEHFINDLQSQIETHNDPEQLEKTIDHCLAIFSRDIQFSSQSTYQDYIELINVFVSFCHSCRRPSVWHYDTVLFSPQIYEFEPNINLSPDIRHDYTEAASIIDKSPRGAAALLRLCIQKLCIKLELTGKNINDDIKTLVAKGLDPHIQQALDIVRVIGNEAVHPGQMDLKDDRDTATSLFEIVNIIADELISRPKKLAALYVKLPPDKLAAIERRDAPPALAAHKAGD